ncbi:MAG: hypothetical protein WA021_05140 [Minisyncoccia bacterium]
MSRLKELKNPKKARRVELAPLVELQIVDTALARMRKPAWVQGTYGQLAGGERCDAFDAKAVKFCGYGFLQRAAFDLNGGNRSEAEKMANAAAKRLTRAKDGRAAVINTNDTKGYKAVMKLFQEGRKRMMAEA